MTATMRVLASLQDWEIVDDDGFIYKRRRREPPAEAEIELPEDGIETEVELLQQRKEILLQKKQAYTAELRKWEELLAKQQELVASVKPASPPFKSMDSPAIHVGDGNYEPYEDLLQQLQEYEYFIRKHSSFCDQAEDMCLLLDEMKYDALQLPSPRQIFP